MTYIVGLTGGIGSGKTTVANYFTELGAAQVDADVVAREVVKPGTEALAAIAEHFGDHVITSNGELDRGALRALVFADDDNKHWLNNLLHPLIRSHLLAELERAAEHAPYVLLVAPLLLENQLTYLCQRVAVIDVSEATQISRASQRDGNSAEQIQAIMAAQVSREERLAAADDIIDNEAPWPAAKSTIERLHQSYVKLAATSAP